MMTKKDYQRFADALSIIGKDEEREKVIDFLIPVFKEDNYRFSEGVFREWIRRKIKGESLKGLKSGGSKKY